MTLSKPKRIKNYQIEELFSLDTHGWQILVSLKDLLYVANMLHSCEGVFTASISPFSQKITIIYDQLFEFDEVLTYIIVRLDRYFDIGYDELSDN